MTDKTEAQPEALRLAEFFESLTKSSHRWWDGVPVHEKAATVLRAQHAEIEQLKAQLSARQAAPEIPEPDFYVRPSIAAFELPWGVCMQQNSGSKGAYLADTVHAMLSAAPPPPEWEPHPPTRHCMCAECAPSFNGASDD